ncbi:MAG: DUF302 domain-containing protein [Beijerinckiaceae bacterium]
MRSTFQIAVLASLLAFPAAASDGANTVRSATTWDITKMRLIEAINSRNFTIFAQIDHAAGAVATGVKLRPTHLVIFGNPRGGTPLMACDQKAGLDLPLKALIWQDEAGAVQVTTNTPAYLGARHAISACATQPLAAMDAAIKAILSDATKP